MMESKTLALQGALQKAVDYIESKIKPLEQRVAPLAEAATRTEEEKFLAAVSAEHKDAVALYPELETWIATLPRHRQIGANFVLDRGTAPDVVELFTEFKTATGRNTPSAPTPPPSITPAAQDRLQRMETVPTRRSATQEPADPHDFDTAFAEALKEN